MSQVETDFMFSLISIGAVMGSFLAGPLSNEMGRRMAIVLTCIPYGKCMLCHISRARSSYHISVHVTQGRYRKMDGMTCNVLFHRCF